jgi:hypothetical protein
VLRGDRGVVPEDAATGFRPRCTPVPPTDEEIRLLSQKEESS